MNEKHFSVDSFAKLRGEKRVIFLDPKRLSRNVLKLLELKLVLFLILEQVQVFC